MKKLVLVLFICVLATTSYATHLMGGQMTSRNIGGLTYEVTVTAYRDTTGIPMYTTATFNYSDGAAWSATNTVDLGSPITMGNGIEEYTYIDTITFPASGNYSMWYEDCCRNCAILNIVNPCGYSFHLYNNLWADATNSSPVFLNPPIPVAQIGIPFTYNPLPFDIDGDSIAWALDTPVTSAGVYVGGYTVPPSDITSPFSMDPVTGEVSFLPNTTGNFEVSVLVNEYRNGVQIGQIRRDMQIIVLNSANRPLLLSGTSGSAPITSNDFMLSPGTAFNVSVTVLDPDFHSITMIARGEPFELTSNPAQSTVINSQGVATGTVNWTPSLSQMRLSPYIFSFRVEEPYSQNIFSSDITFRLNVNNTIAGITPITKEVVRNIYPNPNQGIFTVEIDAVTSGNADLVITNMIGQQLHIAKNIQLNEGVNAVIVNNASLPKGNYLIQVVRNGKVTSIRNFEVAY